MMIQNRVQVFSFADLLRDVSAWIRKDDPASLDVEAIQRLAETSPHLLEDIGISVDDPRFRPDEPETNPTFGR